MKIKKLTLKTNRIQETKDFYTKNLGLAIYEETEDEFSVIIGWSILKFRRSAEPFLYHYCFLIPSNALEKALAWMDERIDILEIVEGKKTLHFEEWNAGSFYFYDGSGNLVEFISHHDLDNDIYEDFNISDVLGINEIAIGTDDVEKINTALEKNCQTEFWKGDLTTFGANGSPEGLFVMSNYNKKETWFSTPIKIKPVPFEIEFENKDKLYRLDYIDGNLRFM